MSVERLHRFGTVDLHHEKHIADDLSGGKAEGEPRLHEIGVVAFAAAGVVEFVEAGCRFDGIMGQPRGIVILRGRDNLLREGGKLAHQLPFGRVGQQQQPFGGGGLGGDPLGGKVLENRADRACAYWT